MKRMIVVSVLLALLSGCVATPSRINYREGDFYHGNDFFHGIAFDPQPHHPEVAGA